LTLLVSVFATPGTQFAAGETERLANGSFEGGFRATPVGFVGKHWMWFNNGGQATYGMYDETWAPVIYDGKHSQLLEINTYGLAGSDADRYSGIYQTVAVVPGEVYALSLHGMMRALEDDPDRACCNYRVEIGFDYNGGTDWQAVGTWFELPWNTVHPRLTPGSMESYSTSVKATSDRLTLFVRVWKKWGTARKELDVNLDAISLKGAMPADVDAGKDKTATGEPNGTTTSTDPGLKVAFAAPAFPVKGWTYTIAVDASNDVGVTKVEFFDNGTLLGSVSYDVGPLSTTESFVWKPGKVGKHTLKAVVRDAGGATATHKARITVGDKGQFLANGDFEGGFRARATGTVGKHWTAFNNGGQATYGYYDETWTPVLRGKHSQLLEINTFCRASSDADRYSGIYQTVGGLTKGATYRFSLYGMLRVLADDIDREGYNYRVQWGYDPAGGTDWQAVTNWAEIPWDTVYPRLDPGEMSSYKTSFVAPSSEITLFVRAWKKWGTARKELDVNLDDITLEGYW